MPYFYQDNIAYLEGNSFALTDGSMPKSLKVGEGLFATSSMGLKHNHQEDAVLLAQHPNNQAFKLLAVADGLGGTEDGSRASSYAIRTLVNSFAQISAQVFYEVNEELIGNILRDIINDINNQIYANSAGQSMTTLVLGLVCQDKTYIASIGDSRAYILDSNGRFGLLTKDDSDIFNEMEKSGEPLDNIRFHKRSNIMNKCLGQVPNIRNSFRISYVENEKYSKLLFCSDGVSDCLSSLSLEMVMKLTNNDVISHSIVSAAIDSKNISYAPEGLDKNTYFEIIMPGKDNTTAALLVRK